MPSPDLLPYSAISSASLSAPSQRDRLSYPDAHIACRFGTRLRTLRKEQRLTQDSMAAKFGIDRSFISDLERGHKSICLPMLDVLAQGLHLSLSDLLRNL